MAPEYLSQILEHKRSLLDTNRSFYDSLKEKLSSTKYSRYRLFKKQISKEGKINLIAEIKKASPSKGVIREEFDPLGIAKIYQDHGAAAISVLTEDKYFLGKPAYVKQISDTFNVPVLTKDFIIDEGQVFEARYNGASAILLIVAILDDTALKNLYQCANELDLDCLIEVHNEKELERALSVGAEVIGINNRDLKTFEVTLETAHKLIPKVPKEKVIVAESGITTHEDVKTLEQLGAHAVLIGETFMKAQDIGKKIEEIMQG